MPTAMNPTISIFTCPKAFTGDIGRIQTNAIRSWQALGARVGLLGYEEGLPEVAEELHAWYGVGLRRNVYGTPFLDSIFASMERETATDLIAFVNTDILLWDDFLMAASTCAEAFPKFLMCGQRSNVDVEAKLRFDGHDTSLAIAHWLKPQSKLEGVGSSDYFVFRKETLYTVPPFALGRWRWDNFLMDMPRQLGFPLVDATEAVFAAHQNHAPMPRVEGDAELNYNNTLVSMYSGRLGRLTDAAYTMTADFRLHQREQV